MKKVFFLLTLSSVFTLIFSCKNHDDDDQEIRDLYAIKADSVKIPQDTMVIGVTQEIKLYSTFQKGCEGIYSFDYQYTNDSVRTVANIAYKLKSNCGDGTYVDGSRINFKPVAKGVYKFRFWSGKDASGKNTFLERNIVVK